MVEKAGGRLTVQAQTPFTTVAATQGERAVLRLLDKEGAHLDLGPFRGHDLAQRACAGGVDLHRDLVGFQLHQRLVGSDGLTRFLFPLQQGGLGHGLGQLRNFDVYDCHGTLSVNK